MTKELKPLYRVVYQFNEDDPIDPDYFDDLSSAILKMMENFFANKNALEDGSLDYALSVAKFNDRLGYSYSDGSNEDQYWIEKRQANGNYKPLALTELDH